jgi:hypothetical protein
MSGRQGSDVCGPDMNPACPRLRRGIVQCAARGVHRCSRERRPDVVRMSSPEVMHPDLLPLLTGFVGEEAVYFGIVGLRLWWENHSSKT